MDNLKDEGGGDSPEALLDGLHYAALLNWSVEKDKYLFIIGDAPPHSKEFHSLKDDKWPNNDEPCKLNIDEICSRLQKIKGSKL